MPDFGADPGRVPPVSFFRCEVLNLVGCFGCAGAETRVEAGADGAGDAGGRVIEAADRIWPVRIVLRGFGALQVLASSGPAAVLVPGSARGGLRGDRAESGYRGNSGGVAGEEREGFMKEQEHVEVEGRVVTVLAGTMFRVELENKHQVLATISGKMRKRFVRLVAGDRVKMEMSPYDLTKARITWRIG